MNILFIGDITGSCGRKLVSKHLSDLRAEHSLDLTIANVDNAAHGKGITPKIFQELAGYGVDVMTGGNHIFDRKEIISEIDNLPTLLRGANYSGDVPGNSVYQSKIGDTKLLVTHLIGRTFMGSFQSPFSAIDSILEENTGNIPITIVDLHGEATSEKNAFARYVDGRVSAVIGTHTHVQTADEQISLQGTAFITDVGMTGPHGGIIGMSTESVMPFFLTGMPARFEPATTKPKLHAVLIRVDEKTGFATGIERIQIDSE